MFWFEGVTTSFVRLARLIFVRIIMAVLVRVFFPQPGLRMTVNFDHNHLCDTVVSFTPVGTVGNAAFYDRHPCFTP
jgi:hypothetical protein